MKKTYKSILMLVMLVVLLLLYLINSQMVITSIIEYSTLFLTKLFPVTFLFFIFSSLLIDYGLIELLQYYLNVNTSNLYIFLLSLISGFPSGAKYTKELLDADLIDIDDANKIIMYSHFPNPLFVLGSVYLVLKDKGLCLKILLAIILSNFIIYLVTPKSKKKISKKVQCPKDFSRVLTKAIKGAFSTILLIYGTSLFFHLIAMIITKYIVLDANLFVLVNGFFDLTKGVFSTTLINNKIISSFYILLFISFGGLSIHMQIKSILADTSIKYNYFLKGRVFGTILAFIIFYLLLFFI